MSADPSRARADALIGPMTEADLDALMEVERLSFRVPWSRQVFLDELARPSAFIDVLRASPGAPVTAFCNYWHVADEVQVLKIATHPDERRKGHGARLLEHMVTFATTNACRLLALEVRRSNEEAQRIYRRYGFRSVGVRQAYYVDDGEDAVVMTLPLAVEAPW